jgi:SAM-dependent methyltransferase
MKTRESGMPPEEQWSGFFDPATVLAQLGLGAEHRCVVDLGCGYGTFAIPAAQRCRGAVHALDIDSEMVARTQDQAAALGLSHLKAEQRDFLEQGSGLPTGAADYVMLFNLLHAERPELLLAEARRLLAPGGTLAVMHWNYDAATPRGPSMSIRLRPEQCQALVREAGFRVGPVLSLPPYHYGFTAVR